MTEPISNNALQVTGNPNTGLLRITMLREGKELASIDMPAKDASKIAAVFLGRARNMPDRSGQANPSGSKDHPVELTVISPSGHTVGAGRTPTSTMAIYYFGEAVLGIELPNEHARTHGQHLMTSAAEGTQQ
jgi:hypothetical protein